MRGLRNRGSGGFTRWAATALLWAVGTTGAAFAQTPPAPTVSTAVPAPAVTTTTTETPAVVPAGCSSCSKGLAPGLDVLPTFGGGGGCASCGDCGGAGCVPGRYPCDCCLDESTCVGRLLSGIYHCICCPDPCYEPHWVALADAAFFQEGPRPVTQMNLRYEHVWDYPFPDKAEYLWPRSGGGGTGPGKAAGATSYRDLVLYNEVGIDRFSASVAIPYVQMSPLNGPPGASGFGDITIGTKSMLLDCELIQLTFAFNTIVPSGNFNKALGTNHVSLEPAGLMALKLHPRTYLQSELAYRIAVGGDNTYQGPVLHYHCSLNHLLWCCGHDIQLIGVAELNGYELLGGAYSDPAILDGNGRPIPLSAKSIGSILNIGPGVRLVICDKIDFGVGSAFNITRDSMGDEMLRVQFRWRF